MKLKNRLLANLLVALLLCALPLAALAEVIDNDLAIDGIGDLAIPSETGDALLDMQDLDGEIVLDADVDLEGGASDTDPGPQAGQGALEEELTFEEILVDEDVPIGGEEALPEEDADGVELVGEEIVETAEAANAEASDFEIVDGVLKKYNGAGGEVTVPEEVTAIGSNAFQNCAGLTKVEFPKTLTAIESYAFASCTGLKSITIPASVKTIDEGAFYGLSDFTITTPCKSAAHTFAKNNEIKLALVHDYDNDGVCTRCKTVRYTKATAKGYSGTYDGKAHGLTVTVTTPASGGAVKYGTKSGSCTKSALTYTSAGAYTIYYEAKADGYAAVSGSAEVKIAKKTVGLTWTNTALTYSGADQQPKAAVSNLAKGDSCAVTVSGAKKDAGTYTAQATKLSNSNYTLPKTATKKYTIKPLKVKLTWKKTTLTYNGKKQKPKATVSNLIKGDKCTVTVGVAKKNAGTYTAKATKLSNANYVLPKKATVKYTIKPLTVELAWAKTRFTYDGKSHVPTATVSNLVKGDKCAVTVSGAQKKAGTYTATATKLSNRNYVLPKKATVKFTIVKK